MTPTETLVKRSIVNNDAGPTIQNQYATQLTTASALTLTAAQIFGGMILRDPNGANRTDTLPTAALIAAHIRNLCGQYSVSVASPWNPSWEFMIENRADAAETITVAVGTGGTLSTGHTVTIAQSNSRRLQITMTSMVPGSEAYTLRNRGGFTT